MTESPHITARERRKRTSLAATFVDDASLERFIEEAAEGKHPVTPALRMRIGYYKIAKDAARAAGKESTR